MSDIVYTVSIGRFPVGQRVWALLDNKVQMLVISKIHTESQIITHPETGERSLKTNIWYSFNDLKYPSTNLDLGPFKVYASKQELLDSL